MAPDSIWEIVFLMVILKIPIVYLAWVIWWAIKAEPRPEEGAAVTVTSGGDGPLRPQRPRLRPQLRPRGPRAPHGAPVRGYARSTAAPAAARVKLDL